MSIDYAHVRTVTVKSITPLPNDRKISMWNGVFIITTKKERKMMNIQEKAGRILEFVGGKDNVTYVTYCMTRLRITPKDKGLIQDEDIQKMTGIVGTKTVGTQYQIIIGSEVENVYKEPLRPSPLLLLGLYCYLGGTKGTLTKKLPIQIN